MPFESKSQWRKFFAMARRGEMPESTAKEWAHKTKSFKDLPEKKKGKKKAAEESTRAEQVAEGAPQEKAEHHVSTAESRRIAGQHADEFPGKDYYGELEKMEDKLKKKEATVDMFEQLREAYVKAAAERTAPACTPEMRKQADEVKVAVGEVEPGLLTQGWQHLKSLPEKVKGLAAWKGGLGGVGLGAAGTLAGLGGVAVLRNLLSGNKESAAHDEPYGGFGDGFISYCRAKDLPDDKVVDLLVKGAAIEGAAGDELAELAARLSCVGAKVKSAAEKKS